VSKTPESLLFQFFRAILDLLREIRDLLEKLVGKPALSAKGELMPASIALNGNGAVFTFTEFDGRNGTGNSVPPIGVIQYASDNAAVASVDASGNVTAIGVGTANISGTDPGNGLTASDQLTVTPAVALSATGVLTANPL